MGNQRVGIGYDVHAFADNRPLILGGLHIPYEKGLAGHSDADVLTHALIDALLGALALGDIGDHFPDTEATYKDADSIKLLQKVYALIKKKGYELVNADTVILAQAPTLKDYKNRMAAHLAGAIGVEPDQVSVKATTTERLGFVGKKEGIAAHAVVSVQKLIKKS